MLNINLSVKRFFLTISLNVPLTLQVTDCLTTVKSVNKTDATTLLSTFSVRFFNACSFCIHYFCKTVCLKFLNESFQSLEGIINASKEELVLCPGLGPQKVCICFAGFNKLVCIFLHSKTGVQIAFLFVIHLGKETV